MHELAPLAKYDIEISFGGWGEKWASRLTLRFYTTLRLIDEFVILADVLRRAVHHSSSQGQEEEEPRSDRIIDPAERLWGPLAGHQEAHFQQTGWGYRTRRIRLNLLFQDRASQ
jgi:transposase InsO family protein